MAAIDDGNLQDDAYWWKNYLETVFQSKDELQNYAEQYNLTDDKGIQERLQEMNEEVGRWFSKNSIPK